MGSTMSLPTTTTTTANAEARITPASAPAPGAAVQNSDMSQQPALKKQTPQTQQPSQQQITPPPSPTPDTYTFPADKLQRRLTQPGKTPLVLVACGSFSPITKLHVQMFELATRHIPRTEFEIVGNYLSPCR